MAAPEKYAPNGRLGDHLDDSDKRRCLTLAQRLKICIGAARGLKYLQTHLEKDNTIIHGNVNSRNIMLDKNMEAKNGFFFVCQDKVVMISNAKNHTCTHLV